jgi:hypothetical protein
LLFCEIFFFVHNFFRGSLVCLTKEKKNISSSTRLPSILINKRPELVVEPGRQFSEKQKIPSNRNVHHMVQQT